MKKIIIDSFLKEQLSRYYNDYLHKQSIGKGRHSVAYDYNNNKVIKFPINGYYHEDFLETIKFMKEYPQYFAKIFKATDDYVIQEKLDVKKANKMFDELFQIFKNVENEDEDSFGKFWGIIEYDEEYSYKNFIEKIQKEHNELYKFLREVQDLVGTLGTISYERGIDSLDFTDNQFGFDKNGEVKLVDI